jgi:hypothetical protein
MQVVGDVKCYHCGHISGQVEGERTTRLVLQKFTPRQGYKGDLPSPGQALRCERCSGPVFLEDLRAAPAALLSMVPPASRKRSKSSRNKAA